MTTITISSKGQVTIPAKARKELNLKDGDTLLVNVNPETRSLNMRKPTDLDELTKKAQSYIKPGTRPVIDVDAYYQKYRVVT